LKAAVVERVAASERRGARSLAPKRNDESQLARCVSLGCGFELPKASDHGFELVNGLGDEFRFFVLGEKNRAALYHPNLLGFW
jgi:hypothetical protein